MKGTRPGFVRQRLEDLEWLAETGECSEGAAYRLGISRSALQRFCERYGRSDLWAQLRAHDPLTDLDLAGREGYDHSREGSR